jgi:ergothioneine biosynthesis protein EgtB
MRLWMNPKSILDRYKRIRKFSEKLCEPLETEDFVIQSMPDMSPTKWHLAHTSWFFETFVLKEVNKNYKSINEEFAYLFNSYYVQAGPRFFRHHRGLVSRPTVKEVFEYRNYVDHNMIEFFEKIDDESFNKIMVVIEIGLNHEQQHQELMLTDIKHLFSMNPLYPVYKPFENIAQTEESKLNWIGFEEGIYKVGYEKDGFFYDNEKPEHKQYLNDFSISDRLVTNREYLEFMNDDGYKRAEFWLSDGIATVERENWEAPLYWRNIEGKWMYFTLNGFRDVELDEPVCHVSHYEADAYARWAKARLATEAEWEVASANLVVDGNFVESELYHPTSRLDENIIKQMYGNVWEWTQSSYLPYPGYKVPDGAIGEYNGKFMSNQMVLRGGSCATSITHIRNTYRNFFPAHARWQFMGIRLAKDTE